MLTGEGLTASAQKGNLSFIDLDGTSCLDDKSLEVGYKGPSAIGLLAFTKADAVVFNKAWFEARGETPCSKTLVLVLGPLCGRMGNR